MSARPLETRLERALAERRRRRLPDLLGLRRAAVLIPLVHRPAGPHLLFIARRPDAPTHAGQIAFPGGGQDAGDPDRTATALREAHEEVGIPPADVRILGFLDDLPTATSRYVITPVLGAVDNPVVQPEPGEVARILEVPLPALLQEERWETRPWGIGRVHVKIHYFHWRQDRIWGATAAILRQLVDVLSPLLDDPDRDVDASKRERR